MGALLNMNLSIICLALAVTVAALPSNTEHESVVPENSFLEESYQNAKETVRMMQSQGKDDNACRDLADATEKEVKDNAKTAQELMNKIPTGKTCNEEGQAAVKAAENAKNEADDNYKKAQKKCDDAKDATVVFPGYALSSLTEGQCSQFFSASAYTDAKSKRTQACDEAKKDVDKAKEAAKELVRECQCKAYTAHEDALRDANTKFSAANLAAWTKAAHLKCVLDGKTTNQ